MTVDPAGFFPPLTAGEPTVSGCTKSWADPVATLTGQTPAATATTAREVRLFWLDGYGEFHWSVRLGLASLTLTTKLRTVFYDDNDIQQARFFGHQVDVSTTSILTARIVVPPRATKVEIAVISLPSASAAQWTEEIVRLEQVPVDTPLPLITGEYGFGDVSPNGVQPPAPSSGLPGREADSPARRSPQVRWAQATGSLRPDLSPKRNALDW